MTIGNGGETAQSTYMALDRRDSSVVVAYTGARGSGKTLTLTARGCQALALGYAVWSNVPIQLKLAGQGLVRSIPLDINALRMFDKDIAEGWVLLDELNLWCASRQSMTLANRLLTQVFTMIRKRRLSFLFTTQDLMWVDKQIRWQVDVHTQCRDAYFTPWGREQHIGQGEVILLRSRDLSGRMTGYTYAETGREYPQILLGKRFWSCYDTEAEFDIFRASQRIRINTPVMTFNAGFGDEQPVDATAVFGQVVDQCKAEGREAVALTELQARCEAEGTSLDARGIGRYAKRLGLARYRPTGGSSVYRLT